jgi:hypothetical protein
MRRSDHRRRARDSLPWPGRTAATAGKPTRSHERWREPPSPTSGATTGSLAAATGLPRTAWAGAAGRRWGYG